MKFHLTLTVWALLLAPLTHAAAAPLVDAARHQIGVTLSYDPAYRRLPYPGGDVPLSTGVCSDVLIRAFRELGVDLQKAVHEDMKSAFDQYPKTWGLRHPDSNIDHRRVPNLMSFFRRRGWEIGKSRSRSDYQPGDLVTWDLGRGVTHIGIVSDRKSFAGTPLILHNIGQGAAEDDILFQFTIIGHYRPRWG